VKNATLCKNSVEGKGGGETEADPQNTADRPKRKKNERRRKTDQGAAHGAIFAKPRGKGVDREGFSEKLGKRLMVPHPEHRKRGKTS